MTKSTDLRVGNFLMKTTTGETFKIEGIDIFRIDEYNARGIEEHPYEYILLSEEWLERLGFHYASSQHGDTAYKYHKNGHHTVRREGKYFYRVPGVTLLEMTFVHQIQNLHFALTGQELTVRTD